MKPGERCVSCFFRIYLLVIISSYPKCGLAAKGRAVPFIIGGHEATSRSWPWQLSLYDHGSHNCGAVLLSKRYALTATHCVTGSASQYQVKLGAHNLNNRDWNQSIQVQYIRKHSNYSQSADGKPNDIAILQLSHEAQLGKGVQPVNITHLTESFVGAECYITGWGRTDPYVVYPPPPLQEARTDVISNEDCSVRMSGVTNGKIHDSHVCVYDSNRRVGSCTGDSGGPLSCKFPGTNDWVVAGVTSWGVSSCSTSFPSVYTRVSSFISWIYDNTGGDIQLYPPLTTTYSPSDTPTTPANVVSTKVVISTAPVPTRFPFEAVVIPLAAAAGVTMVASTAVILKWPQIKEKLKPRGNKSKKISPSDAEKAPVDTKTIHK